MRSSTTRRSKNAARKRCSPGAGAIRESTDDLGALDADAIDGVREEAWPVARNADEMHEALTSLACVTDAEAQRNDGWPAWLEALAHSGRATRLRIAEHDALWVPVERLMCVRAVYRQAPMHPRLQPPAGFTDEWTEDDALVEIVRARLVRLRPADGFGQSRGRWRCRRRRWRRRSRVSKRRAT